jgi:magnesium chelatase family protein
LTKTGDGDSTHDIRERVVEARALQARRFEGTPGVFANGHMTVRELRQWCHPSRDVARLLQRAVDGLGLSARSYHRVLKVARTVADLGGSETIKQHHVAEALQYRYLDRVVQ